MADYPIDPSKVALPERATVADLLSRREALLAEILRMVPIAAREELREALTPPTFSLLFSVPFEDVAPLISEIYAIDQALPPGIA